MESSAGAAEISIEGAVAVADSIPRHVAKHVLSGTSTLGASVLVERGATFLANILAARLAGASVFGAYSLGITTANNISTYAAGGIGATATRFSGKYPYDSGSYGTLARALGLVSLVSAAVAAAALSFCAGPIARLLHKPDLTGLLQWAAISAAGMILLECARGFFVGQRRLMALALLSLVVGGCMLSLLPAMAATKHAVWMVVSHGSVTFLAVITCLLLSRHLGLLGPSRTASAVPFGQILREIWGYGLVQLSGLLSANLAGWWITALVVRGDPTLVQMGFFAIASQLRNLTGIIPGLLTEGSFAVMATQDAESSRVPHRVMAICTFASTGAALLFASLAIIIAPWALRLLYGVSYGAAAVAAAVGMSVAVLQMGNAPPSARLSIISIRSTAVINTIWAAFTALSGTLLMLRGGSAVVAMAVFFAAHVVMAVLVLVVLHRKDNLPKGMVPLFLLSTSTVLALSLLAIFRDKYIDRAASLSALMVLVAGLGTMSLYRLGKQHGWLPATTVVRAVLMKVPSLMRRVVRRSSGDGL